MKIKLTIEERATILQMKPQRSSIDGHDAWKAIIEKVSFKDKELKEIANEDGTIKKKCLKDVEVFHFDELEINTMKEEVEILNRVRQIHELWIPTFKKIREW